MGLFGGTPEVPRRTTLPPRSTGVTQAQSARARLEATWRRLPARMSSHEFDAAQDESLKAIIAAGMLYEKDYATAMGWRTQLVLAGALIAEETAAGTTYIKGEFPQEPDPREWVDRANEELKRGAAGDEGRFQHEQKARLAAEATINAPIVNAKRSDFLFLAREAGLDAESLDARISAAVDARLEALGLIGSEVSNVAL